MDLRPQRILGVLANLVFGVSVLSLTVIGAGIAFVLVNQPPTAESLHPTTLARAKEVVARIEAGELVPLKPGYDVELRLPHGYRDLSHDGKVDVEFGPDIEDLTVKFYPDGGLLGPNPDHYLMYVSDGSGWDGGPYDQRLSHGWWYVPNADWMFDVKRPQDLPLRFGPGR